MSTTQKKELDVVCVGAAIVDIPLQPVSKNIFDCESYPLEQIGWSDEYGWQGCRRSVYSGALPEKRN